MAYSGSVRIQDDRKMDLGYNPKTVGASSYPVGNNPSSMYNAESGDFPHINRVAAYNYDVEAQLIRGTMAFSADKLQELDPSYTGFTHVFVVRMPPVLTQPARGKQLTGFEPRGDGVAIAQAHCKNLKVLLEMGCTSYSGTPDLTLNSAQVATGWSERNYPAPTYSAYDGTAFTLRCLEVRGDLLRKGIEYYTQAVADPNLKLATMNGALDDNNDLLTPTLANMTWSFMIVQTDQTMLNIQDVSLWQNVIINGIDRSNLDWTNGEVDIVAPRDINCTGVYVPDQNNAVLNNWAAQLLATRMKYYRRYKDMTEADLATNQWHNWSEEYTFSTPTGGVIL